MNEPIINPWFFYLIDIAPNIQTALSVAAVALAMSLLFVPLVWSEISKKAAKVGASCALLGVIFCGFASALIPSKQGLISMLVANEVTYERLDLAISGGLDLKETIKADIVEIFEAISSREGDE